MGHCREIMLIHNQIIYVRSFIFCPKHEKIRFHDVIVIGVRAR